MSLDWRDAVRNLSCIKHGKETCQFSDAYFDNNFLIEVTVTKQKNPWNLLPTEVSRNKAKRKFLISIIVQAMEDPKV